MRPKLFLRDHQCITVRQRMTRHPFVHYNALFFCTLSVIHCGNLYFLLLHSFHVAPFPCCTFSWSNIFMLHSFYFMDYFMLCLQCFRFRFFSISYCTCNVFVLHSSLVPLFACCKFFLLHFVHFALFPEVWSWSPQTWRVMRKDGECCKDLHFRCSQES